MNEIAVISRIGSPGTNGRSWKPVQFLVGEWAAEEGNGGSSFDFDLQRKILIRMTLDFDIAPPGKPFANYIHAALRKKGLKR